MLGVFYFNNNYYVLTNNQFIKLVYSSTAQTLNKVADADKTFVNKNFLRLPVQFGTNRLNINVGY